MEDTEAVFIHAVFNTCITENKCYPEIRYLLTVALRNKENIPHITENNALPVLKTAKTDRQT